MIKINDCKLLSGERKAFIIVIGSYIALQSVLYAFAEKFLEQKELDEIKEGMAMTRLGRMIMEDGIQKNAEAEDESIVSMLM